MGFTAATIAGAAQAASKVVEGYGQYQQSKAYRQASRATQELADEHAQDITDTAVDNQRLAHRNAQLELSQARADAAASGLMAEGSVARRESDLATRLEHAITTQTNAALREASAVRRQGTLDAWNLRQQSRNARIGAVGSLLSAGGAGLGAAGGRLNTPAAQPAAQ